jgi:DNA-binding NtrC family response regulator
MPIQHILVVDDDHLSRTFLVEAVQALGYRASAARGGDEGLALAQSAHPDLVITDLRMPGTDGLALVTKLHETLPDLPTVLCTAHGTVEVAVEAMKQGASDFLLKPVSHEALSLVIQRSTASSGSTREPPFGAERVAFGSSPRAPTAETLRSAKTGSSGTS